MSIINDQNTHYCINLPFYIRFTFFPDRATGFKKRFEVLEIILGLFAIGGILIIYNTHLNFSLGIIIGLLAALLTVIVSVLNKK